MLTLYSGSDTYRLNGAIDASFAAYREKYGPTLNLYFIDGSEEHASDEIERPLKYPSFFGEQKLIVIRNAASAAMTTILKNYELSGLEDTEIIAIVHTKNEFCDKKVLAALAKAADRTETFEPLTGAALAQWAREYCIERKTTIESTALATLLQRTHNDMQSLSNELEKLCSFVRTGAIEQSDVLELTPARYEQDEWEFSNALSAHDKRAAVAVLWRRLQDGVPVQMLLASLASGIRTLLMVKDMQVRGKPTVAIAAMTGLHPFVISKTVRGAHAADSEKLLHAHISLARLDRRTKDGWADAADGLFAVLLSL